jgi:hypothetical protein
VIEMMGWKMHYIMDGKYDLTFSVLADSEQAAKEAADSELKEDGILNKHIVIFMECS